MDSRVEGQPLFSLRLFGGFELARISGAERVLLPGKRERMLLAWLALSPNCCQTRQKLATLLWENSPSDIALHNLRTCVWNLRKTLGDTDRRFIISEGETVALNAATFEVDILALRRLAAQSSRDRLEEAAKLYSGEFLEGFAVEGEELESWRRGEAMRARDQIIDVLTRLMAQLSDCGERERAIDAGVRLLALDPLHEPAVRRLMRLYSESGRRGAAVQLYRTLTQRLRTELDAQPEVETDILFAEITRGGDDRSNGSATIVTMPLPVAVPVTTPSSTGPLPAARRSFGPRSALAAVTVSLIAVIALAFYLHRGPGRIAATSAGPQPNAAVTQTSALTVAVLPFANLSGDTAQDFFSDGITEEITSALARVTGLQVVARASAFQFRNEKTDARAAGQALGARYVVNGAVRKAGNRVRITAQLVRTDSGMSVWSDSYDRELTDVFAVQEEIARAITTSLRQPFGLKPDENLVNNRNIDTDSYLQFLRAKALGRDRQRPDSNLRARAIALLEPIVSRYPDFAPGWAQLALNYQRMPAGVRAKVTIEERRRASEKWLAKAEVAAERAIEITPAAADGYASLGLTMAFRGRFVEAEELFSKALSLDPFDPEALHSYANLLGAVARQKAALAMREQLTSMEPFVPVYHAGILGLLWTAGERDALEARLKTFPQSKQLSFAAEMNAAAGEYRKAADTLLMIPAGAYPHEMLENAVRLMRTAPAPAASLNELPEFTVDLNFAFAAVGAAQRVFQPLEDALAAGYLPPLAISDVWHPTYAALRKTERFKEFARNSGLVDYWRAKGWPEQCHPIGGDDFKCN